MTIKSRTHTYGSEHESEWPPRFPENPRGVVGYIDPKTKEFREGYPPDPNPKLDTAPIAILDAMPPTYHEKACCTVESRKEWERLDRETGALTFGSIEEARRYAKRGIEDENRKAQRDRIRAAKGAREMVRSIPNEVRQKLQKRAEEQAEIAKKSGFDTLIKEHV